MGSAMGGGLFCLPRNLPAYAGVWGVGSPGDPCFADPHTPGLEKVSSCGFKPQTCQKLSLF